MEVKRPRSHTTWATWLPASGGQGDPLPKTTGPGRRTDPSSPDRAGRKPVCRWPVTTPRCSSPGEFRAHRGWPPSPAQRAREWPRRLERGLPAPLSPLRPQLQGPSITLLTPAASSPSGSSRALDVRLAQTGLVPSAEDGHPRASPGWHATPPHRQHNP